ncbi:MAG: ATP/GTP-binding protein [Saprospiraceae bacterium]
MILEFSVTNYKSFRDKVTFSMVADEKDKTQPQNYFESNNTMVLKSAVLYGANASGKSNFMEAFGELRNFILTSNNNISFLDSDFLDSSLFSEYNPFEFDEPTIKKTTEFDIYFIVKGIKYHLIFTYNENCVMTEELYYYPNGKRTLLYKRMEEKYEFGNHLKGEKNAVENLTDLPQLFLSNGAKNKMPQLMTVYEYFENSFMVIPFLDSWTDTMYAERIARELYNGESTAYYQNFMNLIKSLDTGITSIEVEKIKNSRYLEVRGNARLLNADYRINTYHKAISNNGIETIQKFQIERESTGTQKLFVLIGLCLRALMFGRVLIIDEFERSLHPLISKFILSLFNNDKINIKKAQLIVATHDTELISKDNNLRRDQVWFIEKDDYGVSDLYALTDVEGVRKETPFDKWYLTNRLGGVPNLKTFNFQINFEHEAQT